MTVITITMPIEERDSELERLRDVERLRSENERLRTITNKLIGVLGMDLPLSDSTEMLLTHACNRVQEIQYLIRQLALAAKGE